MGNELTPTQVKDPPTHIKYPVEENALYTLCMTGNYYLIFYILESSTVLLYYSGTGKRNGMREIFGMPLIKVLNQFTLTLQNSAPYYFLNNTHALLKIVIFSQILVH